MWKGVRDAECGWVQEPPADEAEQDPIRYGHDYDDYDDYDYDDDRSDEDDDDDDDDLDDQLDDGDNNDDDEKQDREGTKEEVRGGEEEQEKARQELRRQRRRSRRHRRRLRRRQRRERRRREREQREEEQAAAVWQRAEYEVGTVALGSGSGLKAGGLLKWGPLRQARHSRRSPWQFRAYMVLFAPRRGIVRRLLIFLRPACLSVCLSVCLSIHLNTWFLI